jgi:hypothetical protein
LDSPIRKEAAGLIGRAKASVSVLNAKFVSLKIPPVATPNQSVGSLLKMLITNGTTHDANSLILESSKIRRETKSTMADCAKKLEELKEGANHWFAVADFLKGDLHVLPNEIPAYLSRAAGLVKSAAMSGAIPASTLLTLIDELKRNGMTSLSYLQETSKRLERIHSASLVACASQSDAFFSRIKHHKGFTLKDQQRLQRHAPIVQRIAEERRKAHAAKFFAEHQLKRTYKGYELTASGVEL